jgi:hypothetical protein
MFLEFAWEPLDVIGGWLEFGEPFDLPTSCGSPGSFSSELSGWPRRWPPYAKPKLRN